jgi:hypothetical protein
LGYQTLSWQPRELEETAETAKRAIEGSERTAEHEDLKIFDYAEHAKQIKEPIKVVPYRNLSEWNPPLAAPSPTAKPGEQGQPDSEDASPEPADESAESEPSQDEIQ